MLNIALPKGRLGEKVYSMFEKAGFEIVQTANLEHWVEQAISRDVILARKP